MSLVVFPCKQEDPVTVGTNLAIAASHERVDEVWAVTADSAEASRIAPVAADVQSTASVAVKVFPQRRLGRYRAGKGDAMNTAIEMAGSVGFERTHFYDADITNFDRSWIDGAEEAADRGYGIVRHRFPRAATDAMVTWMITRPALAKLFPGTLLPRLGQPLGGELLMVADVVEALAADPFVVARSDWGIDTVITHATATMGLPIYEHNASDGKRHTLYGSLIEIKDMVLECLDTAASLAGRRPPPADAVFDQDPPASVPEDLKHTVAYDVETTLHAIAEPPDDEELTILEGLPVDPEHLDDMDEHRWGGVLDVLLARFQLGSRAWADLVFRLWVMRVVHYTRHHVPLGYDHAMSYLEGTIRAYEEQARQD